MHWVILFSYSFFSVNLFILFFSLIRSSNINDNQKPRIFTWKKLQYFGKHRWEIYLSINAMKNKRPRTFADDLWMVYNTKMQMLGSLPYLDASMVEKDKSKAVKLMIEWRRKYPEDLYSINRHVVIILCSLSLLLLLLFHCSKWKTMDSINSDVITMI